MKPSRLLLPAALCGILLCAGCVYDEAYGVRRVTVSTGSPAHYGDYDEYTPYYSHSGRRYYQRDGRYVYYSGHRPYYVRTLPTHATYITPSRTTSHRRVVHHHDRH